MAICETAPVVVRPAQHSHVQDPNILFVAKLRLKAANNKVSSIEEALLDSTDTVLELRGRPKSTNTTSMLHEYEAAVKAMKVWLPITCDSRCCQSGPGPNQVHILQVELQTAKEAAATLQSEVDSLEA